MITDLPAELFKCYHSIKHFSEFLPTTWRQKSTGTKVRHCHPMYRLYYNCYLLFFSFSILHGRCKFLKLLNVNKKQTLHFIARRNRSYGVHKIPENMMQHAKYACFINTVKNTTVLYNLNDNRNIPWPTLPTYWLSAAKLERLVLG